MIDQIVPGTSVPPVPNKPISQPPGPDTINPNDPTPTGSPMPDLPTPELDQPGSVPMPGMTNEPRIALPDRADLPLPEDAIAHVAVPANIHGICPLSADSGPIPPKGQDNGNKDQSRH